LGAVTVKIKFLRKPEGSLLNVGKEITRGAILTLLSHNSSMSHTPTNITCGSIWNRMFS